MAATEKQQNLAVVSIGVGKLTIARDDASQRRPVSVTRPDLKSSYLGNGSITSAIMFLLSRLEQSFRVQPRDFSKPLQTAIVSVIDQELLDKVVHDLGLCITLYDIIDIQSGEVYPNDGGIWFNVIFRLVIFRPFIGEIIIGRIKTETRSPAKPSPRHEPIFSEGLQLTLGFFEDITIPEHFLPDPSFFDEQEGVWFWNYTNDEGETNQMYMEPDDEIKFKVRFVSFCNFRAVKKRAEGDRQFGTAEKPFAPMQVFGEISTTGLGPLAWWRPYDDGNGQQQSPCE